MRTSELYDKSRALAFYQERYSGGYMDEWPIEKKRRVLEVIQGLGLPDEGEALDFGCGNGVFAEVLKQALPPGWKVYGTDISEAAITNARKRYPGCSFYVADNGEFIGKRFDFLFTHHVLEHVYDLRRVLDEIVDRLKSTATMLHILPCGNEGSFEHSICLLRKDGIDSRLENRFFFEDVGHVRRLTSATLGELCSERHYVLAEEFYSNQYHGAINWITESGSSFIRLLTDTTLAVDRGATKKLRRLRYKLLCYWHLRRVAMGVRSRLANRERTLRHYVGVGLRLPLYWPSRLVDSYLERKALDEWRERKKERNGSEMYVIFKR